MSRDRRGTLFSDTKISAKFATVSHPTTPDSTLCVGEHVETNFGMQVYHSKSQPTDDKLSTKSGRIWRL